MKKIKAIAALVPFSVIADCQIDQFNKNGPESADEFFPKVDVACHDNYSFSLKKLKNLTDDYVLHYDKAIVLGTSSKSYVETQKKSLLLETMKRIDPKCINLNACVTSVICFSDTDFNLAKEMIDACLY